MHFRISLMLGYVSCGFLGPKLVFLKDIESQRHYYVIGYVARVLTPLGATGRVWLFPYALTTE